MYFTCTMLQPSIKTLSLYRKDTEPLYHSIMNSLFLLKRGYSLTNEYFDTIKGRLSYSSVIGQV